MIEPLDVWETMALGLAALCVPHEHRGAFVAGVGARLQARRAARRQLLDVMRRRVEQLAPGEATRCLTCDALAVADVDDALAVCRSCAQVWLSMRGGPR